MTFNGEPTFNPTNSGLLHFKGTNSFKLNLTPENDRLFKHLTIDFKYEEPLPDNMVFFRNLDRNGNTYSQVELIK